MNKFIIVVVFLLSVISFYLFFETPSNSRSTNTNQNEQTMKKEKVIITTTASESKKIDNNTKKEIQTKDFKTDSGRIRFTNEAIKKIEMKIIKKMTEQITIGEQRLTWRQVIRREVNKIKKCIVETNEYEPFTYR